MVRSAHCGRHKIGFAVQWMVIAWFSWQSCSCNGARMVSLWSGCTLFDCFFLVLGWSSWKSCACNGARMVSLWSNCTLFDWLPASLRPQFCWSTYGQAALSLIVPSWSWQFPPNKGDILLFAWLIPLMVLVAFPMLPTNGVADQILQKKQIRVISHFESSQKLIWVILPFSCPGFWRIELPGLVPNFSRL